MSGYTPLFSSIIASTIWRESKETKILWITMLAMCDARGMVEASVPGLADMAKITLEECKTSLSVLSAPDEYSRTKDHDGRRIEAVDGGWIILNHAKFREKCRHRADYMREYRARNQNVTNVTACNPPLPPVTDTYSTHTHTQTQKNTLSEKSDNDAESQFSEEFELCWKEYPDKSGKNKAFDAFKKARRAGVTAEAIKDGMARYIKYVHQRQETDFPDLKFKNGATWFHQRCWQDEYVLAPNLNDLRKDPTWGV